MDTTQANLFALAEQRMVWIDHRQTLLAQNIANASLPGYQPRDAQPFARVLQNANSLTPVRTMPAHLAGTDDVTALSHMQTDLKVRSPDGNAVALDEQLTKVADTDTTQAMVMAIYKKYLGMFSEALGHSS